MINIFCFVIALDNKFPQYHIIFELHDHEL